MRVSLGRSLPVVLRLAVAAALFFALAGLTPPPPDQRPKFPGIQAAGLDGGLVATDDFHGMVVLVNFWATWCKPCQMELPEIQKLYDKYNAKGLVVLSMNTDDDASRVPDFLKAKKLSLPIYRPTWEDQKRLGISSIPTTIVIDQEGRVVFAQAGYSSSFTRDVGGLIESLLQSKKRV